MLHSVKKQKLSLVRMSTLDRRAAIRTRIKPVAAWLSDLYREQYPAHILNVSDSGLGIKSGEEFKVNFPILIECADVFVLGNVRHCVKTADGQFLLGLEIHRAMERSGAEIDRSDGTLQYRLTRTQTMRSAG